MCEKVLHKWQQLCTPGSEISIEASGNDKLSVTPHVAGKICQILHVLKVEQHITCVWALPAEAPELSEMQLEHLIEDAKIDKDGDGQIDQFELKVLLDTLCMGAKASGVSNALRGCVANGIRTSMAAVMHMFCFEAHDLNDLCLCGWCSDGRVNVGCVQCGADRPVHSAFQGNRRRATRNLSRGEHSLATIQI